MATITEDYVSFEIAKLLKEKGFDEPCRSYFINDLGDYRKCAVEITNGNCSSEQILRPTLQMAMKWLRKVHNIVIEIRVSHHFKIFDGYSAEFVKIGGDVSYDYYLLNNKRTYEEAVEAAIKYCLEKLI